MKTAMCTACNGTGQLYVIDERYPDEPPTRHCCNSCDGNGVVEIQDDDGVLYTSTC